MRFFVSREALRRMHHLGEVEIDGDVLHLVRSRVSLAIAPACLFPSGGPNEVRVRTLREILAEGALVHGDDVVKGAERVTVERGFVAEPRVASEPSSMEAAIAMVVRTEAGPADAEWSEQEAAARQIAALFLEQQDE